MLNRISTIAPSIQIVTDTSIYAAGDLIGKTTPVLSFDVGGVAGCTVVGLTLTDAAKQSAAIDVVFFSSNLSGTTLTDNAAFAPVLADLTTYLGHVNIVAGSYSIFSANSAAVLKDINLPLNAASTGSTIYAVLVSRGTPTYAAATNLRIWLTVARM